MPLLYYIWNIVEYSEGPQCQCRWTTRLPFQRRGLIISQATRGTILEPPSSIHFFI